jgi:pimeloyl-ACP methyl ester carboxylesterase
MTTDGDPLAAWYAGPQNGAVIVLAHGASNSRESMRPYAQMLVKNGFGVLAYDQRGQGESGGQTNLYGWEGEGDVAAVMQFLSAQKDVKAIGGLGLSLGGEVLLGAASANPAMKAIVGEGTTRRSLADVRALPSHANPIQWLQPWVTYATVHLLTGNAPPTAILDSIKGAPLTHFLLIAAQDVEDEVEFAGIFADAAPGRAEVWAIPTGGHTGGFENHPEEYEQRVIKFLKGALLK